MTTKSVYVSYSWTAERETPLLDELGYVCKRHGLELRRDKDRLKHRDLIRTFMDELASSGDIITIFSDSYFKSEYCMYELLQIWKNGNFQERIHPIQLNSISLNNPDFQLNLADYWENKTQKLQVEISKRHPAGIIPIIERSATFANIYQNITQLVDFVSNMVITPLTDLRSQGFQQLFENIERKSIDASDTLKDLHHKKNSYNLELEKILLENRAGKIKLDQVSQSIQNLESIFTDEHKKLQKWLSENRKNHAQKVYDILVDKYGELITKKNMIATKTDVDEFKMTFSHFIDDLVLCLLDDNIQEIDEPFIDKTFDRDIYKDSLSILSSRIPSWASVNSKNKLVFYINYLIERI